MGQHALQANSVELWQAGPVGPVPNAWPCHTWQLLGCLKEEVGASGVSRQESPSDSLFLTRQLSSISLFIIFAACDHLGIFPLQCLLLISPPSVLVFFVVVFNLC